MAFQANFTARLSGLVGLGIELDSRFVISSVKPAAVGAIVLLDILSPEPTLQASTMSAFQLAWWILSHEPELARTLMVNNITDQIFYLTASPPHLNPEIGNYSAACAALPCEPAFSGCRALLSENTASCDCNTWYVYQ